MKRYLMACYYLRSNRVDVRPMLAPSVVAAEGRMWRSLNLRTGDRVIIVPLRLLARE
jgi:hypothetical protein